MWRPKIQQNKARSEDLLARKHGQDSWTFAEFHHWELVPSACRGMHIDALPVEGGASRWGRALLFNTLKTLRTSGATVGSGG